MYFLQFIINSYINCQRRICNIEAEFRYVIIVALSAGYILELVYTLIFLRSKISALQKSLLHLACGVLSKIFLFWGFGQAVAMNTSGKDGIALGLILWLIFEFVSKFVLVRLIIELTEFEKSYPPKFNKIFILLNYCSVTIDYDKPFSTQEVLYPHI